MSVVRTRAPDAPIGWAMAIAPPLSLAPPAPPPGPLADGEGLGGEGLVGLDEVEIGDRPAGLFKRLLRCRNRADAHDRWIDASARPARHAGEDRSAALLGLLAAHQDKRGG